MDIIDDYLQEGIFSREYQDKFLGNVKKTGQGWVAEINGAFFAFPMKPRHLPLFFKLVEFCFAKKSAFLSSINDHVIKILKQKGASDKELPEILKSGSFGLFKFFWRQGQLVVRPSFFINHPKVGKHQFTADFPIMSKQQYMAIKTRQIMQMGKK